ncbi:uncharacterized protein LOC130529675 isoform X2 [Takifugu flavidus]|uniref:uncharacterized protein LOC130529675 isoform X2 n=1 Tax=Takifugu flavidus TaxID=433684 RepID=UPI0025445C30|nr:uncharacterized protein LOC130529675 isoform X2 [Takifugu flavidus]
MVKGIRGSVSSSAQRIFCSFLSKMTTPSALPVKDQDGVELRKTGDHVSDGGTALGLNGGSIPEQGLVSPSEKMTGSKSASSLCRLSSVLEPDSEELDPDGSCGGRDWGGSIFSVCSDRLKHSSSSGFSSDDSHSGDDCALLLLACLHCRFHDFMVLLPGALEAAVSRCFPSYGHVRLSTEQEREEKDCCGSKMELDCNCCGSCKDTGEFIEFAMEISEVCYR